MYGAPTRNFFFFSFCTTQYDVDFPFCQTPSGVCEKFACALQFNVCLYEYGATHLVFCS